MSSIKTIDLIDDIRNDALILIKNNPELKYEDAFMQAKQNLIGDQDIFSFKFSPLEVEIDDSLISEDYKNKKEVENKNNEEEVDYYTRIKNKLSDKIDVNLFNNDQLEQLYIGLQMNIDITKIANPKYNSGQIKFLCVMIFSKKDITKYLNNFDFNPMEAFIEMAESEN